MFEVLNSYLFQHKSISIPGLGTIFLETLPASSDIGNKHILPPVYHFRFDKYFDAPDKDFFSYLAAEKNMADYEAIKWYNEFSYELRNRIKQEDKVKWDDVGVLRKDYAGNIIFESASGAPRFLKPVSANAIIRKDAQHSLLVGDKETSNYEMNEWLHPGQDTKKKETWWMYALVIGLAALLVLLFHFSSNHGQASPSGNQQKLELVK
jgi:hypothetical protein